MTSVKVKTAIPVTYHKTSNRELPLTGSENSTLAILLGLSMTACGLYGVRLRKPYGR